MCTDVLRRVVVVRKYLRRMMERFCLCGTAKPGQYESLPRCVGPGPCAVEEGFGSGSGRVAVVAVRRQVAVRRGEYKDEDVVSVKISLLGDRHIGKTSFLTKYVGDEKEEKRDMEAGGLNYMDKIQYVHGARLFFTIYEVAGNNIYEDGIPAACQDSVAILFMFDLTSRCTLNNIISWYQEARKWNQTAIPILIGTKFDDFVQLPIDLQWTIASQARAYAKAINATLFFSSSTYNINVNKVFKFITAKLFNLPWSVERNLTVGQPIIDF